MASRRTTSACETYVPVIVSGDEPASSFRFTKYCSTSRSRSGLLPENSHMPSSFLHMSVDGAKSCLVMISLRVLY